MTIDETWLYHYDPETKQQSVEWRHSGSPKLKEFRVQKSAGKFLAWFFLLLLLLFLLSRRHPPHCFSSKDLNYQLGVLLICAGAIEGHFERKTPRGH